MPHPVLENYRKLLNEELQYRGYRDEYRFRARIVKEVVDAQSRHELSPRMRLIWDIILGGDNQS